MIYADNRCTYVESIKDGVHIYTYSGSCVVTGKPYSIDVPGSELFAYRNGKKLQDAFVSLSPEDREFLLSGVSPEGWAILYHEEENRLTKEIEAGMPQEEEDLYVREIDEEEMHK